MYRIQTIIFTFLLVLPVAAQEFIPGDDTIIEKDILRRIQEELGQDITREKKAERNVVKEKEEKKQKKKIDSSVFQAKLKLKNKKSIQGRITISQQEITLKPTTGSGQYRIPIREIKSIAFENWEALNLRKKQADQYRVYFFPTRCTIVKRDGSTWKGEFNAINWMQFNVINDSKIDSYRAYYRLDRKLSALPKEQKELKKFLKNLKSPLPENAIVLLELGEIKDE